jgi:transcriptional regulator GlxA family with amidase domain
VNCDSRQVDEASHAQAMSPECMARTVILQYVQKQERTDRIRENVLKKLDENPELKKAYQTLVKNLPEDQQEKIMANLAMRTQRTVSRRREQVAARPAQKV